MALLLGFLESVLDGSIAEMVITCNINALNLNLAVFIDIYHETQRVDLGGIRDLLNIHINIVIALFHVKGLYPVGDTDKHVICHDIATCDVDFVTDVIDIALADSLECEFGKARAFCEINVEKYLIVNN